MGQVVPTQHPAVVLRSHFNQLRALLAAALIAVIGLTVAVVILAGDQDQISDTRPAALSGQINYGGVNPVTGRPESAPIPESAPFPHQEHPLRSRLGTGTTRYDSGPEEGTRGPKDYSKNSATGDVQPPSTRYDGGPEEGTRGVLPTQAPSAAADGSAYSQLRRAGALRYDGGPEEGTRGPRFGND